MTLATFQLRRDTAADWTAGNPVLAAAEPGWESDTQRLKVGDGVTAWTALAYHEPGSGGSAGGGVLAYKEHLPAVLASYTTASTALVDVDAANLAVTFVVPASGRVLVRLTALASMTVNTADNTAWGLREGAAAIKQVQVADASTSNRFLSVPIVVTGLAPGASKTYKWAWRSSVATATARLYAGPIAPNSIPAVMEVTALP